MQITRLKRLLSRAHLKSVLSGLQGPQGSLLCFARPNNELRLQVSSLTTRSNWRRFKLSGVAATASMLHLMYSGLSDHVKHVCIV